MIRIQNYIGGEFTGPVAGDAASNWLPSANPSTGLTHLEMPRSGAQDVDRAVQAAKKAFSSWSALLPTERAAWMDKIADEIDKRREAFVAAESADQGKSVTLAGTLDIPRASLNFRFFAGVIRQELSVAAPLDNNTFSYVRREPMGVAGLISPWNLPLYLLTWKIAPAIAYGNTCVAKPSEMTSHTAFLLAEVLRDISFPPGVVNLIFGLGGEAGQALVEHPDVPVISFTGGTVTGRKLASTAAPMLKKVSLELGGKNPTIVFGDVNLKRHMPMLVKSAFQNQGEICLCGSRIYVEKTLYAEFVDAFVRETRELKVGDPSDPATFMGPLVSDDHRKKVEGYIEYARSQGLTLRTGGGRPKVTGANGRDLSGGFFLEPTVITAAPGKTLGADSRLQQEEIFGPVVTIVPFENEDEAVTLANGTKYGLAASVWTESLQKAHDVAARLHAGNVWINGWMMRDLRMPFGGVKESGIGREGQMDSLHVFTEPKTVYVRYKPLG